MAGNNFIGIKSVLEYTGLSESTLRREMDAGRFPESVQLTIGRVGWRVDDVKAWCDSRTANAKHKSSRELAAAIAERQAQAAANGQTLSSSAALALIKKGQ